MYLASSPERGTDGRFLQENVKETDFLTDDEIQRGAWLDSDQVDPGTYYVMLEATQLLLSRQTRPALRDFPAC